MLLVIIVGYAAYYKSNFSVNWSSYRYFAVDSLLLRIIGHSFMGKTLGEIFLRMFVIRYDSSRVRKIKQNDSSWLDIPTTATRPRFTILMIWFSF